jgi:hypothetical protein
MIIEGNWYDSDEPNVLVGASIMISSPSGDRRRRDRQGDLRQLQPVLAECIRRGHRLSQPFGAEAADGRIERGMRRAGSALGEKGRSNLALDVYHSAVVWRIAFPNIAYDSIRT